MPSLSETQSAFRLAVVDRSQPTPSMLVAPASATARLAIYRRHHFESLVRHLAGRFPTVEWMLGTSRFIALAEPFIHTSPPGAPCMAEYGEGFVGFLNQHAPVGTSPYIAGVAQLDWMLGNAAIAVETPPVAIGALSTWPADRLPDLSLHLQPGVAYLASDWPIDDLVRIRLGERQPEQLEFVAHAVALEVRGARGQFGIGRLDKAEFEFRSALQGGTSLGAAIERSLSADPDFDVSTALATLFAAGLVAEVLPTAAE